MRPKDIFTEIGKTFRDILPRTRKRDEWPKRGQGRVISPRGATTTRANSGKSLGEHILGDGSSS